VGTGFPKKIMLKQKIERDDDSKKSHHALGYCARRAAAIRTQNEMQESAIPAPEISLRITLFKGPKAVFSAP
jgi:hypothetical protein